MTPGHLKLARFAFCFTQLLDTHACWDADDHDLGCTPLVNNLDDPPLHNDPCRPGRSHPLNIHASWLSSSVGESDPLTSDSPPPPPLNRASNPTMASGVPGFHNMLNRSGSTHALASLSHPDLGQLATQQRAPRPYPGQGPSSLTGSLGYTANLSSAGSDRASPSSTAARTNLAAQMGFGSDPNLQGLDQIQTQLPRQDQLTWQQQLLAQQQQQQAPYGSLAGRSMFSGGFQSHQGQGRHLSAVPTWQNSANPLQQPATLGYHGQGPRAPAPASSLAWNGAHSHQGPYASHHNQFGAGHGTSLHAETFSPLHCSASGLNSSCASG